MKRLTAVLAILAIMSAMAITSQRASSAPTGPEIKKLQSYVPEFSGEYGGAFRDLNIVETPGGPVAVVIQRDEVVIYDATDVWAGGSSDFHQLPKPFCRSRFGDIDPIYIDDIAAELRSDGEIQIHVLYINRTNGRTIMERMEFARGGHCQTRGSFEGNRSSLTVGYKFIYLLGAYQLTALDKTTLEIARQVSLAKDTMYVIDFSQDRLFLAGNEGRVDILDANSLSKVGEIEVGHTISQIDANGEYVMVRHVPFVSTVPDDHDFSVYQLTGASYERVLTVNDAQGLW